MNKVFLAFLFLISFLLGLVYTSFAQRKKIAVIGSSSAYGFGATPNPPRDSSCVNRTKRYYKGLGIIYSIYNLGNPCSTTYAGMSIGFVPPTHVVVNGVVYDRSALQPDPSHKIIIALSFNPDLVIINYLQMIKETTF